MTILNSLDFYRPINNKDGFRSTSTLHIRCARIMEELYQHHSGCCIGITVSPGVTKGSLEDAWNELPLLVNNVVRVLFKRHLIAGAILSIEMYRRDSKSRVGGRALRPHIHIAALTYNAFLNWPVTGLQQDLDVLNLDRHVELLPTAQRGASWMAYCLKGLKCNILQTVVRSSNLNSSVTMYVNPHLKPVVDLGNLHSYLNGCGYTTILTKEVYQKHLLPSVRFSANPTIHMSRFVRQFCLLHSIGAYNGSLHRRKEGTMYTWERLLSIPDFISQLTNLDAPDEFLELMAQASSNIAGCTLGGKSKLNVFPSVHYHSYLWEFEDARVFDCRNGELLSAPQLDPFNGCGRFHQTKFCDLPWPTHLLNALNGLLINRDEALDLMTSLGGMFHNLTTSRKQHRCVWLYGVPDSHKSWFVVNFLKHLFSDSMVYTLNAASNKQFMFENLKNVKFGVIFADDIGPSSVAVRNAEAFTNLIDGNTVNAERKYEASQQLAFRGNLVATSNFTITHSFSDVVTSNAVAKRFSSHGLTVPSQAPDYDSITCFEWVSFGLLCNSLFIRFNDGTLSHFPDAWLIRQDALAFINDVIDPSSRPVMWSNPMVRAESTKPKVMYVSGSGPISTVSNKQLPVTSQLLIANANGCESPHMFSRPPRRVRRIKPCVDVVALKKVRRVRHSKRR